MPVRPPTKVFHENLAIARHKKNGNCTGIGNAVVREGEDKRTVIVKFSIAVAESGTSLCTTGMGCK
jgi:hypothetical protein